MSYLISSRVVALATVFLAAACSEGTTATSSLTGPETESQVAASAENTEVALLLDEMAVHSASVSDQEAATAYAGGALALRFGVEPTPVVLNVNGVDVRYRAVMTAFANSPTTTDVGVRTLVAWTANGEGRTAIMLIAARSDEASFDPSGLPTGPGLAKGVWANLTAGMRFQAETGSSTTQVASIAGRCPVQPGGADPRVTCRLARFTGRIGGVFVNGSGESTRVDIAFPAQSFAGAILARTDGDDPVRPPVAVPGRPLPKPQI